MELRDITVTCNGTGVNGVILTINTEQNICSGIGTITMTTTDDGPHYTPTFMPGDELVLFHNSTKIGTYTIFKVDETPNTFTVMGQNGSYKLSNYFIPERYEINYATLTRYWIDKFLTEAGLDHTFITDDEGTLLQNDSVLGMQMLEDAINPLLQQSGWYLFFNHNNHVEIGKLIKDVDNSPHVISNPFTIDTTKDDKMLRNRGIVWGKSNPYTEKWVYAFKDRRTGYETWGGDTRPIVLANGNIWNTKDAQLVASQLINEFSKLTEVTTITTEGNGEYRLGQTVKLDTAYVRKYGLITNVQHDISKDGFITTLTLDQRCPRIIAFFSSVYVYVATDGNGIWRTNYTIPDGWHDFSNGIAIGDKVVTDLKINDGIFACVAGKKLYYRSSGSAWVKYNPGTLYDSDLVGYTDYICSGCVINKTNGNICAVYTNTSTNKSWIVEITASGILVKQYYAINSDGDSFRTFDIDLFGGKKIITNHLPGTGLGYVYYNYPSGAVRFNDASVQSWGAYNRVNESATYEFHSGAGSTMAYGNSMFNRFVGGSSTISLYKNCNLPTYDAYTMYMPAGVESLVAISEDSCITKYGSTQLRTLNIVTGSDTLFFDITSLFPTGPTFSSSLNTFYRHRSGNIYVFARTSDNSSFPAVVENYTVVLDPNGSVIAVTLLTHLYTFSPGSTWWVCELENLTYFNGNGGPTIIYNDGTAICFKASEIPPPPIDDITYIATQLAPSWEENCLYKITGGPGDRRIMRLSSSLSLSTCYSGPIQYTLLWSDKRAYAFYNDTSTNIGYIYSLPSMLLIHTMDTTNLTYVGYQIDTDKNSILYQNLIDSSNEELRWFNLSTGVDTPVFTPTVNVLSYRILYITGQVLIFSNIGTGLGTVFAFPDHYSPIPLGGAFQTLIENNSIYEVIDTTPGPTILENSQESPIIAYPLNWNDYRMEGLALSGMSGIAPESTLVTNFRISFSGISGSFYSPISGFAFSDIQYSGAAIAYIDDLRSFYTTPPDSADSTTASGISDNEWLAITQSGVLKNNDIAFSNGWGIVSGIPASGISHIETGNFELAYFAATSGTNPRFFSNSFFQNYTWTESISGLPSGYAVNLIRLDDQL